MTDAQKVPLLSLSGGKKAFGAVHALIDGRIELYSGEAHALVGENGAGKSTIVKALAGIHSLDEGVLQVNGQTVALKSPSNARAQGIAVIYQEPTLFPDLSVAENIFMERQPLRGCRRIDYGEMNRSAKEIFRRLGVAIDPDRPSLGLSIAEQQLVEIAKALSFEAKVVIMDEPTAALSSVEAERLFDVVRALRESDVGILFISHRLEEVFRICQRATVMRDGRFVLTTATTDIDSDGLVRAMVGRSIALRERDETSRLGEVVLDVSHLTQEGVFTDVSFQVRRGEVVALAGLVGAGRSEVATAIFGIRKYDFGQVKVNGKPLPKTSPSLAMAAGVALVPEDRRQQGLVMDMSIARNIAMASTRSLSRFGLIRSIVESRFAKNWSLRLKIKSGDLSSLVSTLSGGNQQKVVLAKWMSLHPQLLIVDEPTRGIDVATKAEVHRLLVDLAKGGVGVLVISSELPEVLVLADRILVMREGSLVADIPHAQASEESIIALATTGIDGRAA